MFTTCVHDFFKTPEKGKRTKNETLAVVAEAFHIAIKGMRKSFNP